jgi:hypothetical protein
MVSLSRAQAGGGLNLFRYVRGKRRRFVEKQNRVTFERWTKL